MKQIIRGAAVQASSVTLDPESTTEKACELIREAGRNSADVIVFPECFIPAYPSWFQFLPPASKELDELNLRLFKTAIDVPGPETLKLGEATRSAHCYAVVGVCERSQTSPGSLYNTQLFFGPDGKLLGKHQKLTPTGYERMVHWGGAGDTLTVIDTTFGPLSALLCSENSNPLASFDLVAKGPKVHAMSWPPHFIMVGKDVPDLPDVSRLTARNFALMSKAFVISACGLIDRAFYKELADLAHTPNADLTKGLGEGGSAIISPNSSIIGGNPFDSSEKIIYADLDLDMWSQMKILQDFAGHYNRPDVFTLDVNRDRNQYEKAKKVEVS